MHETGTVSNKELLQIIKHLNKRVGKRRKNRRKLEKLENLFKDLTSYQQEFKKRQNRKTTEKVS